MIEIKKTLAVLRARWPEVVLIVGLHVLSFYSMRLFRVERRGSIGLLLFLSMVFALTLPVVSILLNFGFLRTVYLEGQKRQEPLVLLRTGKGFFWRMVGLGLIYVIPGSVLVGLTFIMIRNFTSIDTGFFETAQTSPGLNYLCFTVPMLILMKFILLIPAIILVLDCRVFESFSFLRRCKLSDSRELVALFCLQLALPFLWLMLGKSYDPETGFQHILGGVSTVIGYFLRLIISVTAVVFVGSLDLVYDDGSGAMGSEDPEPEETEL